MRHPLDHAALALTALGLVACLQSEAPPYCIGTLFARSLYAAFLEGGGDPNDDQQRAEFMRSLVQALQGTQPVLLDRVRLPLPDWRTADCDLRETILPQYDGEVLGAFFDALLSQWPADRRAPLCAALSQRFGEIGFPVDLRGECGA